MKIYLHSLLLFGTEETQLLEIPSHGTHIYRMFNTMMTVDALPNKKELQYQQSCFDLIINYLGLCKHNRWVPLSHDLILTIAMSKVAHTKDFEPQNAHYIGKVWDDKCDYFVENLWCDDKTVLYSWEWRCLITSWTLTVQGQDHCKL